MVPSNFHDFGSNFAIKGTEPILTTFHKRQGHYHNELSLLVLLSFAYMTYEKRLGKSSFTTLNASSLGPHVTGFTHWVVVISYHVKLLMLK
jgi:hypothetical protein